MLANANFLKCLISKRYSAAFCDDKNGATLVEFALVAPIFLLIFFAIIELSLFMFASAVIEHAATSAARLGITGNTYGGAGGTATEQRENFIRDEIQRLSFGLFANGGSALDVTPSIVPGLDTGVDIADYDPLNAGFGGAGQAVMYRVTYNWAIRTPIVATALGTETLNITTNVLVQNEEFDPLN